MFPGKYVCKRCINNLLVHLINVTHRSFDGDSTTSGVSFHLPSYACKAFAYNVTSIQFNLPLLTC